MADHTKAPWAWQAVNEGLPEDKADWQHAVGVAQGGVVPAKPAQSYGKTQQETAAEDAITKVKGGAE